MKFLKFVISVFMLCWGLVFPVNRLMINTTGKSCSSIASIQCLSQLTSLNDVLQKTSASFAKGSVAQKYWQLVQDLKKTENKDLLYPGLNSVIDDPADANDATKALLIELAKLPHVKNIFGGDEPEIISVFDQDGFKIAVKADTKILCFNLLDRMAFPLALNLNDNKFDLKAFVVHSGGAAGGHFWSYAKDIVSNTWYLYEQQLLLGNIEKAKKIDEEVTIKNVAANKMLEWSKPNEPRPYILFYERVETKESTKPEDAKGLENIKKSLETLATKLGELMSYLKNITVKKVSAKRLPILNDEEVKKIADLSSQFDDYAHQLDVSPDNPFTTPAIIDNIKELRQQVQELRNKFLVGIDLTDDEYAQKKQLDDLFDAINQRVGNS